MAVSTLPAKTKPKPTSSPATRGTVKSAQADAATDSQAEKPLKPTRRSQQERRAETQRRLCDAAIQLLTEVGYERLTIQQIAERAGVSKGAQAHHYPTKEDMLLAAFGHLMSQWKERRDIFLKFGGEGGTMDDLLRYMWQDIFGHPQYAASLELMLASRHSPSLRDRMRETLTDWTVARNRAFQKIVRLKHEEKLAVFMEMNFCLLRGMAISESLSNEKSLNRKVLAMWTELATEFVNNQQQQQQVMSDRRKSPSIHPAN